jgi:hypothetical protein
MARNPKVDEALAAMMRATTSILDVEPEIPNKIDVCYESLTEAHEEIGIAARALQRAIHLPSDVDEATRQAIYEESWRSLIQLAVSTHLAIGRFPFLDKIERLFPGNDPGFSS